MKEGASAAILTHRLSPRGKETIVALTTLLLRAVNAGRLEYCETAANARGRWDDELDRNTRVVDMCYAGARPGCLCQGRAESINGNCDNIVVSEGVR